MKEALEVCVCVGWGGGGGVGGGEIGSLYPIPLYFILKNIPYHGNRQNIPAIAKITREKNTEELDLTFGDENVSAKFSL